MEENNTNMSPEIQTSKGNNKRSMIIVIAVIVIFGLTAGVLATKFLGGNQVSQVKLRELQGTPQEIVFAAMLNTRDKAISETQAINKKTGTAVIENILSSEAAKFSFESTFKSIEGMEDVAMVNAMLKDAGIVGELAYSKDGEKFNVNLAAKQGQLEIANALIYKEGSEIGVDVPQLFANPYAIKLDTLYEDLQASPLYSMAGGTEEIDREEIEQAKEIMQAFGSYFNGILNLQNNKEFMRQMEDLYKQNINECNFTEGNSKVITTGSTTVNCKTYSATLTGEQIAKISKSQMEVILKMDFIADFLDVIAEAEGTTREALIEQTLTEYEESQGEIDIELWIDDQCVRGGAITVKDTYGEEAIAKIEFGFTGEKYLMDEFYAKISADDYGDTVDITLTLTNNLGEDSAVVNKGIAFKVLSYGEETSMAMKSKYDTQAKDNNFEMSMDFAIPYEGQITLAMKGNRVVDPSAKEVKTSFSEINFSSTEDDIAGKINVDLNCGVKAIKKNDIKKDDTRETKYILEMSTAEILGMIQTIQNNLQTFGAGLA